MPVYKHELTTLKSNGTPEVRWQAYVYDKNMGRKRYLGTFRTKGQAIERVQDEGQRIKLGKRLEKRKDIGFSDLVDEWLEVHVATLRENTQDDYKAAVKYLRRYFRNTPVSSIERRDVALMVAWLCKQSLGVHSVRKFATRLTQIFNFAIEFGYMESSPTATGIKNLPKAPKKRIEPLTPDELRSLVEATPQYWQPLILVMATSGLRRSEAFGLTVRDIDFERSELHVRQQLVNGKLVVPKTENALRVVPLAPSVLKALETHLANRPPNNFDLVFPTESGTPVMGSNFIRRIWAPAVAASGIKRHLTMHDLRRTYGSMTARHGRSAAYLQQTMGHSNARTSLTYYVGIYGDEQKQAVADVEKWLGSDGPASLDGKLLVLDFHPHGRNRVENSPTAA